MEEHIAITIFSGRISPVFDVARTACIYTGKAKEAFATIELPPTLISRADVLAQHGVKVLVCGAVSRPARALLEQAGIRVIGFLAGDATEILDLAQRDRLPDVRYAMPGCRHCCQRGRGRRQRWRQGDSP